MPIRETFWNIPHWAEIAQYVVAFITIVIFLYGFSLHVRRWRTGQKVKRIDRLPARVWSLVVHAIAQLRVLRDPFPGIMHLAIFWGMVALLIGTALATIDWDVTHLFFGFQFLKGGLYVVYELVLDILGLLLIVGLGLAIYRRYIVRPERLQNNFGRKFSWDDGYVLGMLSLVAITGYLVEGLRIAVVQPDWAAWSPVGNYIASIFSSTGDPTNMTLHLVLWIAHGLVAFTLLASIPFTKLSHLLTVPLNIFFRSLEPAGALAPARYSSSPGIKTKKDFTWKQLLDFDSCIRCGRCQEFCAAHASGLDFSPRDLIVNLNNHLWERDNGRQLYGEVVTSEEVWACTTCYACSSQCPAFIEHVSEVVDMRRHLVDEGEMDALLQEALNNLGRYGNSFGQSERMRARWSQGLPEKIKDARREAVEYIWFVGDYASYNASAAPATRITAEVLTQAGLDFGILYEAERNSGNDIRRVGEEGLFEMLVEKNSAVLEKCDYKAVFTTDPHTYNTLKNEYGETFNGHGVLHISELVDGLIAAGKLKFTKKLDYRVTFHDPCYLGRYNEVYEQPRRVIQATGCELVEMPRHGDRAFCCGAGGGRIWMEEAGVKERPSEIRVREAAQLEGVQVLVVACPKDISMFKDAIKTCGVEDRLVVKDMMELVYEAMQP
jgi:Fe-S oxidoreductase/nitrate reductase gamma subunit